MVKTCFSDWMPKTSGVIQESVLSTVVHYLGVNVGVTG